MRDIVYAIVLGFGVFVAGLLLTYVVISSQPQEPHQLHNAYWPFSVEASIRDR